MNVFDKRPLAITLSFFVMGFVAFTLLSNEFKGMIAIIAILLAIIPLFLSFSTNRAKVIFSCAIALSLAMLFSHFYFQRFELANRYSGEITASAVVEEVTQTNAYTTRMTLKCNEINGDKIRNNRIYLYISKSEANTMWVGSRITFTAKLKTFSNSDSKSYAYSRGISAIAEDVSSLKVVELYDPNISIRLSRIRYIFSEYSILVSDKDSGALLSALLFGERNMLPDDLRLNFKIIGISHILALSGMHLSILALGISILLRLLRIGKKASYIVIIIFSATYMAFVGFTVSITRAAIMLITYSLLFLLSKTSDSVTALSLSSVIIVITTPTSIYDVALPLTLLATFGVLLAAEIAFSKKNTSKRVNRFISPLWFSILSSVFAICATLAVTSAVFGGISVISVFSTLIFTVLIQAVMYLGCISLAIGWFIPVGKLISPLSTLIISLADRLAKNELVYVPTNTTICKILIAILSIAFFVFAVVNVKKRRLAILVIFSLFFAVNVSAVASHAILLREERCLVYTKDKCDEMIVSSNGEICLINSSGYSTNLAYDTLDFLASQNVLRIDKYYLTHYAWSIDDDLKTLLSNVKIDTLYLPVPRNDEENDIYKFLLAKKFSCNIKTFELTESVSCGNATISLLASAPYGETSVNAFKVNFNGITSVYISSGILGSKYEKLCTEAIDDADYIIFGSHGKKHKDKIFIEEECVNKTIILTTEGIYFTPNSYENLVESGGDVIYRPTYAVEIK